MSNSTGPAPLIKISTIHEVAALLCDFKPEIVTLPSGRYSVSKLPADQAEQIIAQLEAPDGLLYALGLVETEQQDGEGNIVRWSPGVDVTGVLRAIPDTVNAVVAAGATKLEDGAQAISHDEKLLLAAAVLTVTYLDNPAVMVFFGVGNAVGLSVTAERSSEPAPKPGGTDG